jgi:hypothetical protein
MTEGRQPLTAEIKTLAKGPSTYDPLGNRIVRLAMLTSPSKKPRRALLQTEGPPLLFLKQ